jgi:Cryptococcal mannosyltransferase 1
MKILLCSIVRNEERHLDRWYAQIKRTVQSMPEHQFTLSVYENDSTDGSDQKLRSFDWSFISSFVLTTAKLNCPFFVGGKHPQRTELLAYVRNQTMTQSPFLGQMDYVLWIEPDTEYTHEVTEKIINHEKHYGVKADVFTGKSVHPNSQGIYDSWGTRKTANQTDWKDEDGQTAGLEPLWSTWNCYAMYNAEPIKKGLMFSGVNPRTGASECDTVSICESFRLNGYDKILWHTDLHVVHFCT